MSVMIGNGCHIYDAKRSEWSPASAAAGSAGHVDSRINAACVAVACRCNREFEFIERDSELAMTWINAMPKPETVIRRWKAS